MTSDRKPDSAETRRDKENVKINDLPTPDAADEKVKGGFQPVDGRQITLKPVGPVDA